MSGQVANPGNLIGGTLGKVMTAAGNLTNAITKGGFQSPGKGMSNIMGAVRGLNQELPGNRTNQKIDPLGNRLEMYGRRDEVATPLDPFGRKMGLYGYTVEAPKDWGTYNYGAADLADPNASANAYETANRISAANMEEKQRKSAAKTLLGQ